MLSFCTSLHSPLGRGAGDGVRQNTGAKARAVVPYALAAQLEAVHQHNDPIQPFGCLYEVFKPLEDFSQLESPLHAVTGLCGLSVSMHNLSDWAAAAEAFPRNQVQTASTSVQLLRLREHCFQIWKGQSLQHSGI